MDLMLLVILGCVFGVVLACAAASKREKEQERREKEREKEQKKQERKEEQERSERDGGIGLSALIVFIIIGYLIAAVLLGGKDMMQGGTEETSQMESTEWVQP